MGERHLTIVYAYAFAGAPPPSQVLLALVMDDVRRNENDVGGIYIHSVFVGWVVGFPVSFDMAPG